MQRGGSGTVLITAGSTEVKLFLNPFKIEFFINSEIALVVNSRNLLNVEHYRAKRFDRG